MHDFTNFYAILLDSGISDFCMEFYDVSWNLLFCVPVYTFSSEVYKKKSKFLQVTKTSVTKKLNRRLKISFTLINTLLSINLILIIYLTKSINLWRLYLDKILRQTLTFFDSDTEKQDSNSDS
jgi:hypothetical protein